MEGEPGADASEPEVVLRLRRAYDAFNRDDFDAAVAEMRLDPDFVLVRERLGRQGPIEGAEAYRQWLEPDAIEDQQIEPTEFYVADRKVLVRQLGTGRGAASGIEVSLESWALWTFDEEGHALQVDAFPAEQRSEALRAAGLPE